MADFKPGSEPDLDGRPRRPPQTIEVTAVKLETPAPAAATAEPPNGPAQGSGRSTGVLLIIATSFGAVATLLAAWRYGLHWRRMRMAPTKRCEPVSPELRRPSAAKRRQRQPPGGRCSRRRTGGSDGAHRCRDDAPGLCGRRGGTRQAAGVGASFGGAVAEQGARPRCRDRRRAAACGLVSGRNCPGADATA